MSSNISPEACNIPRRLACPFSYALLPTVCCKGEDHGRPVVHARHRRHHCRLHGHMTLVSTGCQPPYLPSSSFTCVRLPFVRPPKILRQCRAVTVKKVGRCMCGKKINDKPHLVNPYGRVGTNFLCLSSTRLCLMRMLRRSVSGVTWSRVLALAAPLAARRSFCSPPLSALRLRHSRPILLCRLLGLAVVSHAVLQPVQAVKGRAGPAST